MADIRPPIGAVYEYVPDRAQRVTVVEHHPRFAHVVKLKFQNDPEGPAQWYHVGLLGQRINSSIVPNAPEGGRRRLRKKTRRMRSRSKKRTRSRRA